MCALNSLVNAWPSITPSVTQIIKAKLKGSCLEYNVFLLSLLKSITGAFIDSIGAFFFRYREDQTINDGHSWSPAVEILREVFTFHRWHSICGDWSTFFSFFFFLSHRAIRHRKTNALFEKHDSFRFRRSSLRPKTFWNFSDRIAGRMFCFRCGRFGFLSREWMPFVYECAFLYESRMLFNYGIHTHTHVRIYNHLLFIGNLDTHSSLQL